MSHLHFMKILNTYFWYNKNIDYQVNSLDNSIFFASRTKNSFPHVAAISRPCGFFFEYFSINDYLRFNMK
jgi:hypothetical protein